MKRIAWGGILLALMVLAFLYFRQESSGNPSSKSVTAMAGEPSAVEKSGRKAAALDDGEVAVNRRTRPQNRPPDVKRPLPPPPVAEALPGNPGFVKSPFNDKLIDVRDLPSGTLVADPTFPAEEKRFFRVP